MNLEKKQVRRFYKVVWNAHDISVLASLLHEDFAFRGSIGQEKRGHSGFAEYVDMIHHVLGDYRNQIILFWDGKYPRLFEIERWY